MYDDADRLTKNDHFADMLRVAYAHKFPTECVAFDGWYSSLDNLKLVRDCGWHWITRLKSNRLVNLVPKEEKPRPLAGVAVAAKGTVLWLPGFGKVKVFGIAAPAGSTDHWTTSDLGMTDFTRRQYAEFSWAIESYHRGIERCVGVERCQCRSSRAQRNHIGLALRAFPRLEAYCFAKGVSCVEAKTAIIRDAVRTYLTRPHIRFPMTATA